MKTRFHKKMNKIIPWKFLVLLPAFIVVIPYFFLEIVLVLLFWFFNSKSLSETFYDTITGALIEGMMNKEA